MGGGVGDGPCADQRERTAVGANVYFLGSNGSAIYQCPTTGCNGAATLHTTMPLSVYATSITADATYLYVTATGEVDRIPK